MSTSIVIGASLFLEYLSGNSGVVQRRSEQLYALVPDRYKTNV